MVFPSLITILALIMYLVFAINVGHARKRYGIKAPATTGNEAFERYYRVQQNTLEHLIIFIPVIWLAPMFWPYPNFLHINPAQIVAAIGTIWLIGRIIYALGYYKAADKRAAGFMISALANVVLLLSCLAGIIMQILRLYHVIN